MSKHTICTHDYADIDQACPVCWGDDDAPADVPDLDGEPFCPTGYALRYHVIGECDCVKGGEE